MKPLPKKIVIAGTTYKIVEVDDMRDVMPGGPMAWGSIMFTDCLIRIHRDMPLDRKWSVLLHEIVHGIDDAVGLDLSEENTDRLAICLKDVLVRNKIGLL